MPLPELTQHQEDVKQEILTALRAGEKRIILQGSAGVGKTVLASNLVEQFRKDYTINKKFNNGEVFVTAPTNKALSVLQGKIDSNVTFKTVHSALRLIRNIDGRTGEVKFIKGGEDKSFKNCRVAIVDECSMLNSELIGFLDDYHFPIIFVGENLFL